MNQFKIMDKELKNRSGSVSNPSGKNENRGDKRQTNQPGAPGKSTRQSNGNDERSSIRKANAKKGPNNV
jgi:hypothetical protein